MNRNNPRLVIIAASFVFIGLASAGCTRVVSKALKLEAPSHERMVTERNVMVPMRDGIHLATDIYKPATPGKYPVVLTRIPYGSDPGDGLPWGQLQHLGKFFVKNGYIYIVQDTRGEFDSEGDWFPFVFEHDDGQDAIDWIAEQDWCDGNIGMWGGSYFGYTQLIAAPGNENLDAIIPWIASGNLHSLVFRGGASSFMSMQGWVVQEENSQARRLGEKPNSKLDLSGGYFNYEIRDAEPVNEAAVLADPSAMEGGPWKWLDHPGDTEHVAALNYTNYYKDVSAPTLIIAGWYDIFLNAQLEDFVRFRNEAQGDARRPRLVIGPWAHGQVWSDLEDSKLDGGRLVAGLFKDWYDYWLKGIDNGVMDEAPVQIFVIGENEWRDEYEWPLARTRYVNYYLHSGGSANTLNGDGTLSTAAPGEEPSDQFTYDPENPVPTTGGSFLNALEFKAGPADQSKLEERDDILVYITEPLADDMEITGPVKVTLWAATSAIDTDWTAKLIDIFPDGYRRNLQTGIIRARYRNGLQHPTALEPGQPVEYTIDLWAVCNLFKAGHRIGLEISSSDFPQFDRNTNAGGVGGPDNIVVANQTIYHDEARPSKVTLPVIPR
jgi:uncharacterized protein